jgi:DNA repair protein RecO (recombination protein O)
VFGISAGGLLCPACAPSGSQPLELAVVELLGGLAGDPWAGLPARLAACPDPHRVRRQAGALVSSYLTYHLGRPLKAWEAVPR